MWLLPIDSDPGGHWLSFFQELACNLNKPRTEKDSDIAFSKDLQQIEEFVAGIWV